FESPRPNFDGWKSLFRFPSFPWPMWPLLHVSFPLPLDRLFPPSAMMAYRVKRKCPNASHGSSMCC
ncbi:hypothetical protein LINPERPRIM_LOCUS29309, partial [Linum perenne]